MHNAQQACVKSACRVANVLITTKNRLLSWLKFNIDNGFAYLVMQKQFGNGIKGKEAQAVKEKRLATNQEKRVKRK